MKLVIENLTKKYKNKVALDNVSLSMENGIYALLGPNGAGKTTLIYSIIGLITYQQGSIKYYDDQNMEMESLYEILGYLPQYPSFYKNFSVYEMLLYIATLKGLKKNIIKERISEVLHEVNLWDDKNMKIKALSGGMKQRLGIAQAIMENNDILILDEITSGLDEDGVAMIYNILNEEKEKGKLIMITSHNRIDIENLCDVTYKFNNGTVQLYETGE